MRCGVVRALSFRACSTEYLPSSPGTLPGQIRDSVGWAAWTIPVTGMNAWLTIVLNSKARTNIRELSINFPFMPVAPVRRQSSSLVDRDWNGPRGAGWAVASGRKWVRTRSHALLTRFCVHPAAWTTGVHKQTHAGNAKHREGCHGQRREP